MHAVLGQSFRTRFVEDPIVLRWLAWGTISLRARSRALVDEVHCLNASTLVMVIEYHQHCVWPG
jgi:hypothetical protein